MHGLHLSSTHEISENTLDTISCTSDFERQSWDFDRHSSEEELATINKDGTAEKRKWSSRSGCCDSAGASDEEVTELMLKPQPVLFCSSPPKGVQKVANESPPPKLLIARVAPMTVSSVSPRKRHRQTSTSNSPTDLELSTVIQRPCLDFEKMQVGY